MGETPDQFCCFLLFQSVSLYFQIQDKVPEVYSPKKFHSFTSNNHLPFEEISTDDSDSC